MLATTSHLKREGRSGQVRGFVWLPVVNPFGFCRKVQPFDQLASGKTDWKDPTKPSFQKVQDIQLLLLHRINCLRTCKDRSLSLRTDVFCFDSMQYPPVDLPMILHEVYNEVDGGKFYDVYQEVTFEPEGLPALKAKILNRAEYVLEGDKRISVEFTESKVTLAEGTDLAVWKKVFKDNPDMEEDGTLKRVFPKGKPYWVDILYQDESFRITKGNFGNIVIVEREA